MIRREPSVRDEWVPDPLGGLTWRREGEDLVAGSYRLRLLGPLDWETTYRGRPLARYARRSMALAGIAKHRREAQRVQQITAWAALAALALVTAGVAAANLDSATGFFFLAGSTWVFLSALARCVAATSRNLLDPYRARERWEPRDWYNH